MIIQLKCLIDNIRIDLRKVVVTSKTNEMGVLSFQYDAYIIFYFLWCRNPTTCVYVHMMFMNQKFNA